ncbi:MAG: hypothetical protein JWL84_4302 [Rhodospirillales bacterium]|jgi:hypothetical protein|nr:hypothetical protein [Rhodospirillales bacterium]
MNDYLVELEDAGTEWAAGVAPQKKTLRCLREIKDLDRNRLMHPRETLDEEEAEIFFNLATSAIMGMTRDMAALLQAGQGKLALVGAAASALPSP